ncbi:LuxR C-terminal-related transcriptional regulator [Lentzea sp. NPDC054927]
MITVAVVDDDSFAVSTLQAMITRHPADLTFVTAVKTVPALLEHDGPRAQVVLLDVILADGSTLTSNVTTLMNEGFAVLVISSQPQRKEVPPVIRRLRVNFMSKDDLADRLLESIEATASGKTVISADVISAVLHGSGDEPKLTSREQEIMALIASGRTAKQVARRLGIREDTVRDHVERVRKKYQATGQNLDNPIKIHYAALDAGYLRDGREQIE